MLQMIDNGYPSRRTATRIFLLTSVYSKRFKRDREDMYTYSDEFETLLAKVESMGDEKEILESQKSLLLLTSMEEK